MNIRLATRKDATVIAQMHKEEIGGGFLSSLPLAFLAIMYRGMVSFPAGFCIVATNQEDSGNERIVGFATGLANVRLFYKYFLLRFFWAGIYLAPLVFSPSAVKRILENFLYPAKTKDLPSAELFSIAVHKDYRGKGIAPQMFPLFLEEMQKRNVRSFKLVVGESLAPAIRLYEKLGFRFMQLISLHGKESSRVYVYDIS